MLNKEGQVSIANAMLPMEGQVDLLKNRKKEGRTYRECFGFKILPKVKNSN